jgi:acetyl esterase
MSGESTPLATSRRGVLGRRLAAWCASAAVRASLLVSPRPAALLVRKLFASTGARTSEALARHEPDGVVSLVDERYGEEADMLLDVHRPQRASGLLPVVVWVHGGGFVGGSKEELASYFRIVAADGYAVVAPRYSLAPEHRYPTPTRQVLEALAFLQSEAVRLELDPARIVIGGDSAGAQIAAQVGALVTTPGYADDVGIFPTIEATQLRGLVLACGPYDVGLATGAESQTGRTLMKTMLWAYSGTRRYAADPYFATLSVARHLTSSFPPSLVTVGNGDPLRAHSELLVSRLRAQGLEPETLFFPEEHEPPLGHEYQFDLDTEAGQLFLERVRIFLQRRLT